MRRWGKSTLDEAAGSLLFFALVSGALFSLSCAVFPGNVLRYGKTQNDFLLMTAQSALAVGGMVLLRVADRKLKLDLPPLLYGLFYAFLFCAVYLGEILSFYYLIAQWDTYLHFFSGVMLTLLGIHLTKMLDIKLPKSAAAAFAFCFSVALGVLWEGYEYLMDGVFQMNMQKFADSGRQPFIGRAALRDTMQDLWVDMMAALITAGVWLFCRRKRD